MFPKALARIRRKVRTLAYVVTLHADEQMAEDDLLLVDVENVILNGEIVERQVDRNTGERKYRLSGRTASGDPAQAVVKFGATGKVVILTAYLDL